MPAAEATYSAIPVIAQSGILVTRVLERYQRKDGPGATISLRTGGQWHMNALLKKTQKQTNKQANKKTKQINQQTHT